MPLRITPSVAEQEGQQTETEATGAPQKHHYTLNQQVGSITLGQDTKYGSSFIVMTIIGGGIVTPVMGFVSDAAGNIPTAELVPALCFAIIFIFARFRSQAATN
ncbi:fucose permease [Klebsiella pneumoniae]|nr:fucose permease [Klebsiella pneumoniae]